MNLELRWKQSIGLDEHSERVKLSEEKVDHDSLSTRSILPTMKIHPFLCFLVGRNGHVAGGRVPSLRLGRWRGRKRHRRECATSREWGEWLAKSYNLDNRRRPRTSFGSVSGRLAASCSRFGFWLARRKVFGLALVKRNGLAVSKTNKQPTVDGIGERNLAWQAQHQVLWREELGPLDNVCRSSRPESIDHVPE